MANIKGMNVTGQKVTPNAYGIHERGKYTGSITGMNVTQNSTPNMSVMVAVGTAVLTKNTNSSVTAILDTPTNITIATASTANPRIDTLVVYEGLSVTMPTAEPYSIDAANGRFKIVSIAGTPATSPVALDDTAIQSAIGGANTSWARICTIRVEKSTTTIINSKIDNSVKSLLSPVLAPGTVTADKANLSATAIVVQTIANSTALPTIPSATSAPWSSNYFGASNKAIVFSQGALASTLAPGSGTLLFTQNGKVKLIVAELSLSGQVGSQEFGFFGDGNGTSLPPEVLFWYEHAVKKIAPGGGFSGTTFKYYYNVEAMAVGAQAFINPQVKTYNATFISTSGGGDGVGATINSALEVKLYGLA